MAQRVLSALERAKLVCWFEETNSLVKVGRRYRAEFGMDPPGGLSQVKKWHQRFMETGSVMPSEAEAHEQRFSIGGINFAQQQSEQTKATFSNAMREAVQTSTVKYAHQRF